MLRGSMGYRAFHLDWGHFEVKLPNGEIIPYSYRLEEIETIGLVIRLSDGTIIPSTSWSITENAIRREHNKPLRITSWGER